MDNQTEFEALIRKDRDSRQTKTWHGNLLGYLEKLKEDPTIPKLTHARVYDFITSTRIRNIQESDDPRVKRLFKDESLKVYDFFADEFFGIEKTIAQIVRYFHAASLKGEESRQVLYLMGPVGSGKSSLVEKLERGLEGNEPFYSIENCPMFEEPLHLIPRHLRKEFEKMLGVHIEGDLCPVCRYRLKNEFGNRYEEFPVCTVEFSKRGAGCGATVGAEATSGGSGARHSAGTSANSDAKRSRSAAPSRSQNRKTRVWPAPS